MSLAHRENLRGVPALVARRLAVTAVTVVAVTLLVFALAAISPFDPLAHHLGERYGSYTEAERAQIAVSIGADGSWWDQWLRWVAGVLHGDLGFSRVYNRPVATVMAERLPLTALLSATGLAIVVVASAALGLRAARRPGGIVDRAAVALGLVVAATPSYVYALGVLLVLGVTLHAIPIGGAAAVGDRPSLATIGPYLIGPAIVLAVSQISWPLLTVREAAVGAAASPAVTAARTRGLTERTILWGHIAPMSLMGLVTLIGARLGELIAGAVIVETVFSWPGLAQAVVESAVAVDFPLLAITAAASTVAVMLGSLASDLASMLLDPRVTDV